MVHRVLVVIASLLIVAGSVAQSPSVPRKTMRMEAIVHDYETGPDRFMGSVLVAEGSNVLLQQGYGSASLEWHIPNTPDTVFHGGSLTKQFTAALVLMEQERGTLKLDDPVSEYMADTPEAWRGITLRSLLNHTSGIPNFTSAPDFAAWSMAPRTHREALDRFRDKPLDFVPGSAYRYSNSNYEVLGMVLEKTSGSTYEELLTQRIFKPLGMTHSGLDHDDLLLPKRATGYQLEGPDFRVARSESMTVPWAAGSMYATAGDLLLWETALFGGKLLRPESLQQMLTIAKGDYGMGVHVRDRKGYRLVTHNGGIEGFNTVLNHVPEKKVTVVVLSNLSGSVADRMGVQLTDVMMGKTVVLDSERRVIPLTADKLARFTGVFQLSQDFAMTIAVDGDHLTGAGSNQTPVPALYVGDDEHGHARFLARTVDAELEFVPGKDGAISSFILHQRGKSTVAERR